MNSAVKDADSDIVVLLNDDTEVISAGWLEELVSHAVRPGVGCVGAMLLYPNGTIQHAGVTLGIGGVAGHRWRGRPSSYPGHLGRLQVAHTVSAVTGACLAIRRSIWLEVGGMDEEHLPVAFNDIDLCMRTSALGYRTLWTPEAVLLHHESMTRGLEDTPEKIARFARESKIMIERWGSKLLRDPYWNPNLTIENESGDVSQR